MNAGVLATGATMLSVLTALVVTRGRDPDALRTSARLLLGAILALLVSRLWSWSGSEWATTPLMASAAFIPLVLLTLAEQMCRRHAWTWLKVLTGAGAALFVVVAFVTPHEWSLELLMALATFQLVVGSCVAAMMYGARDLSDPERRSVRMMGLAIVIALPLLLTDFELVTPPGLRLGCVGISVVMMALVLVARGEARPAALMRDLAWSAAATALVVGIAGATIGLDRGGFDFATVVACAAFGLLLVRMSISRSASSGIATAVARVRGSRIDDILSAHPILSSGRILEGEDVELFDASTLDALSTRLVVSRRMLDGGTGEIAREMLDTAQATHLLPLGGRRFLAVTAAGLAGGPMDDELMLVSRIMRSAS